VATPDQIVDLRKLLAERFQSAPAPRFSRLQTGLVFLDAAIGGGLPKGTITEVISPQISAGSASLISALLCMAGRATAPAMGQAGFQPLTKAAETPGFHTDSPQRVRPVADKMSVPHPIALIDGTDSFDPEPLGNACLRHLLWVRCRQAIEAVKAADLLLRDGNFPVVILDLVLNTGNALKIPQTHWYRLQRLVEATSTAFLVLTRRGIVSSAQLKLVLENTWSLETFEDENPWSRLKIHVQRSHFHQLASANGETS
jgi:RecA/RadA recombinase